MSGYNCIDNVVQTALFRGMLTPLYIVGMVAVGLMVAGAERAHGQDYPNRPIRLVTSGIGGGNDFVARLIAQGIAGPLGQPVTIDNRPSGVIPGETVAKAPPDGYTLLVLGSTLWIGPLLQKAPYDPIRDFAPITLTTRSPNILVVHPSLPVKSVKDLIALAKAKPGALNYASSGAGTANHLAGELLNAMAGIKVQHIAYKGVGLVLTAVMSGEVQIAQLTLGSQALTPLLGKLRALAVTSPQPSALFPALPTVAESGVPGYESGSTDGVFAPAKTPVSIINRLNQEIVRFLNQPEVKEKFFSAGVETVGSSPTEFLATMKSQVTKLGKVIKDAGINAD
jgi:tripartite-type tricarboxylate transporter receptor subunit TctC